MAENSIHQGEVVEETALARKEPSILAMMQQVVNRDNPQDMAGALEQLVKLKEHVEDRDARREFFAAFARVQAKLQTVVATMAVPDRQGNIRWYVAAFPDILDAIEPVLREEGFSLRFDSTREGPILTAICYAMHTAGHQESARCHFNAANAQGGDLGALTSAKRGALMEMFALKVRRSDDARLLGDFVDLAELEELQALIKAAGGVDMPKFLKYAGATRIEDIRTGKLPQLRKYLKDKIKTKAAPDAPLDGELAGPKDRPEVAATVTAGIGAYTEAHSTTPQPPPAPTAAQSDRAAFVAAMQALYERDQGGCPIRIEDKHIKELGRQARELSGAITTVSVLAWVKEHAKLVVVEDTTDAAPIGFKLAKKD